MARALARLGVRQITLVDPDIVEVGNLGEMDGVSEADVGRPKVEALARSLREVEVGSGLEVQALGISVTHLRALRAAAGCDLLVSTVDHDGARLGAAAIAGLYLKPLLDIATGIHMMDGEGRVMGADVRLVLPGNPAGGCLLCLGGLHDPEAARRVLASARAETDSYARREWRRERAGSLLSLNQLAASVAVRLLEDFIGERVVDSTWVRLDFDEAGHLSVAYPPARPAEGCPLCGLCGLGEAGLSHLAQALSLRSSEEHTLNSGDYESYGGERR